jgi:hypothetical protein
MDDTMTDSKFLTNVPYKYRVKHYNDIFLCHYDGGSIYARYFVVRTPDGRLYRRTAIQVASVCKLFSWGGGNYSAQQQWNGSSWGSVTTPLVFNGLQYYETWIEGESGSGTNNAATRVSEIRRFDIDYSCTYNSRHELLIYDRLGSWIPVNFNQANYENVATTRVNGRFKYGDLSEGEYRYNSEDRGRKSTHTEQSEQLTLNTDWLEKEESDFMRVLLTSPRVLMRVDGGDYRAVNITNTTLEIQKERNVKLAQYSMSVEYAIQDNING